MVSVLDTPTTQEWPEQGGDSVLSFESAFPAPSEAADVSGTKRTFDAGAYLYRQGYSRSALYRIVSGVVRQTIRRGDGQHDLVEFAMAGDVIGLGFLEQHGTTAQAILKTEVVEIPLDALDALTHREPGVEERLRAAIDVEFAVLRDRAVTSGLSKPIVRIAAFLLAISDMSKRESGREIIVPDDLKSGYVAETLQMSLDCLADGLQQLEARGLIERTDGGLKLKQIPVLEVLAETG